MENKSASQEGCLNPKPRPKQYIYIAIVTAVENEILLLPMAYCLLPTDYPYFLLPIAYCILPIAYWLLPVAYCLLPIAYPFACCILCWQLPLQMLRQTPTRSKLAWDAWQRHWTRPKKNTSSSKSIPFWEWTPVLLCRFSQSAIPLPGLRTTKSLSLRSVLVRLMQMLFWRSRS